MRPKFDKSRYEKYDRVAKEASQLFFSSLYPTASVLVPEENYKDDLIVKFEFATVGAQVEVKTGWWGEDFPFPNMHVPKSKVDNALKHYQEVWFLVFNNDCSAVGVIRVDRFTGLTCINKLNVYSKDKPEPFYEFGLDYIEFYTKLA